MTDFVQGLDPDELNEIWDDSELIKAYDEAQREIAESFQAKLANPKNKSPACDSNNPHKWQVGEPCRAVYSEDGETYEAIIEEITGDECIVKYLGYNNTETIPIDQLKPSSGFSAVHKQLDEAEKYKEPDSTQNETGMSDSEYSTIETSSVSTSPPKPSNSHAPDSKIWRQGDFCRAVYTEDHLEYEAIIEQIKSDWAHLKFLGYGNVQNVRLDELKPSQGTASIRKQLEAAALDGFYANVTKEKSTVMDTFNSHVKCMIPPPPPNPFGDIDDDDDPLNCMLMSWYLNGYYTGYYQGLRKHKLNQTKKAEK